MNLLIMFISEEIKLKVSCGYIVRSVWLPLLKILKTCSHLVSPQYEHQIFWSMKSSGVELFLPEKQEVTQLIQKL